MRSAVPFLFWSRSQKPPASDSKHVIPLGQSAFVWQPSIVLVLTSTQPVTVKKANIKTEIRRLYPRVVPGLSRNIMTALILHCYICSCLNLGYPKSTVKCTIEIAKQITAILIEISPTQTNSTRFQGNNAAPHQATRSVLLQKRNSSGHKQKRAPNIY